MMKHTWKKRLGALIVTAVMTAGMIPGASAACEHNNWSAWSKASDTQHRRTCLVGGCTESQLAEHSWKSDYTANADMHWKECRDCGAQTATEKHVWGTGFNRDSTNHWTSCTVCGHKANLGGHVDLTGDRRCDTCNADMSASYVTVTFKNGEAVFKTQPNLLRGTAPDDPGTPSRTSSNGVTYTFKGWTTSYPGSGGIYTNQTFLTSAQVAKTVVTANTTYYALYTSSADQTISLSVDPGERVKLSRTDFKTCFDEIISDDNFRYVSFATDKSYDTACGAIYSALGTAEQKRFSAGDLDYYDFYYSSDRYGEYPLSDLTFVAAEDSGAHTVTIAFRAYGDDSYVDGELVIRITGSGQGSVSGTDINLTVAPGKSVTLSRSAFQSVFDAEADGDTFRYMTLTPGSSYSADRGYFWYNYNTTGATKFTAAGLKANDFYYASAVYGDYPISAMSFVADAAAAGKTVTMDVRLWGDDTWVDAQLNIRIGAAEDADITYSVAPGKNVAFSVSDFDRVYQSVYRNGTMRYVTFTATDDIISTQGRFYLDYNGDSESRITRAQLEANDFYTAEARYGDYALEDLSFLAASTFRDAVELKFTIYGADNRDVDGTLTITPGETAPTVTGTGADIIYYSTYSANVQINANEIARFFRRVHPSSTLQYVKLDGVPAVGSLYYNYYNASKYGVKQTKLTAANCATNKLYLSPASTADYALTELTYIPNGLNYCVTIPFTAYGSGSASVSGTIFISVNYAAAPEVYGATPKNTTVSFPVTAITNAINSATKSTAAGIRLLRLPDAKAGSITVGTGSTKATTGTQYSLTGTTGAVSQLRFTPAKDYAGSVEIPYVAYNASGSAIAAGKFCLGIVSGVKKFTDVTTSTWCYKYVTELSDAKVIDGYGDNSFRPNNEVTYGQALKLIMLAAGYDVQKPTDANVFSGYLAKAKADGLISGNVNLNQPISRIAVAQIAAKALKLDIRNLSGVKPFTDTADVYVQALNAAGIVEGYFSNGTYTYKGANTLTRGQISAIVWRMTQYRNA